MIVFPGSEVLSPHEKSYIINELKIVGIEIFDILSEYFYMVDTEEALSELEISKLQQLFKLTNRATIKMKGTSHSQEKFVIVPRLGTISPWSSKATDIGNLCGFHKIKRIERGRKYIFEKKIPFDESSLKLIRDLIHDKMMDTILPSVDDASKLFAKKIPGSFKTIDILGQGKSALSAHNKTYGLALSDSDIDYLVSSFLHLKRNPTDVEIMMYSQANSEHCRHKIFNSKWVIAKKEMPKTLFEMIKNTKEKNPKNILSAYKDNGAIFNGFKANQLNSNSKTREYSYAREQTDVVIKVETHNHPTAISPYPGASTGCGGEIRDEGATGRGARPKAGLTGFSVSHLRVPNFPKPWETPLEKPDNICSPYEIMKYGPLGGAGFNNEFGRPNICGFFRTFEQVVYDQNLKKEQKFGFHKPIMIAGGLGNIKKEHALKDESLPENTKVVVLGGPGMVIGLGGGAASSVDSGSGKEDLDFASVQRDNPEMERRCQEVLNSCTHLKDQNPIAFIHDVGAGGLSNALPELIKDCAKGGEFQLREILVSDYGMSPLEIWCNESQERYVLAIYDQHWESFKKIAIKERCPFTLVGNTTATGALLLKDKKFNNSPVDVSLNLLFGQDQNHLRTVLGCNKYCDSDALFTENISISDAVKRVLGNPTVSDKGFLITIGDRSVSGLVSRDQMVGKWQVPVSNVGVTSSSLDSYCGEAMAVGERPPLAILNPSASARMAVGEALTNIASAYIEDIKNIKLSANWQAAPNHEDEGKRLYEAVEAIGMDLCPKLGIAIPVGKDSLSMKMVWKKEAKDFSVVSPVSLVISAFAPCEDIRKTLTPDLKDSKNSTSLLMIDLGEGKNRMGGSILYQVYNSMGKDCPDVESSENLKNFFKGINLLNEKNLVLAYHDRSDGGIFTTICEMAISGRKGIDLVIPSEFKEREYIEYLFNEELGAVIQVEDKNIDQVIEVFKSLKLENLLKPIGKISTSNEIKIKSDNKEFYSESIFELIKIWSETTYRMQSLRDNPDCALEEYDFKQDIKNSGLFVDLSYDFPDKKNLPNINLGTKPKVAILREQGVNSHLELSASFHKAGFSSFDIHMSEILDGSVDINEYEGLAAPGGFSFGDVLGGGGGWAKVILFNEKVRDQFSTFFHDKGKFALGICNGCQMLSQLKEIIPGCDLWPNFVTNKSNRYEARLVMVEVNDTPSIFFKDMADSKLPIIVSHGEGKAQFMQSTDSNQIKYEKLVCMNYVDYEGKPTKIYPMNPNGSPSGITGVTNLDGRVSILMPHPERLHRGTQFSWLPEELRREEESPWMKIFHNARDWVT